MKKGIKIIASLLLVLGVGLVLLSFILTGFNVKKFVGNNGIQTQEYVLDEPFENIVIDVDTSDVRLSLSSDGTGKVVSMHHEKIQHSVTVSDKTLVIRLEDTRKWYDHIGFNFESMSLNIQLPSSIYNALTVETDTGDCEIATGFTFQTVDIETDTGEIVCNDLSADTVGLEADTGDVYLEKLRAKSLKIETDTGDITVTDTTVEETFEKKSTTGKTHFTRVQAKNLLSQSSTGDVDIKESVFSEKLQITTSTGDVELSNSDAGEIFIETNTGDVLGSLLSEKVFITHSSTGDVEVPSSITGGRCEIKTSTGDIEISIVSK